MMIDLATISSLELIQNLQNPKSKDCLFGLLNQTLTPMGSRLLKSHLLQPSTNIETLEKRYNALEELTTREDVFFAVRQGRLLADHHATFELAKGLSQHSKHSWILIGYLRQ